MMVKIETKILKNNRILLNSLFIIIFNYCFLSKAQQVIDSKSLLPIENAIVSTQDSVVFTDGSGSFFISCADSITIQHIGYKTSKFACAQSQFVLSPKDEYIPEVVVTNLSNIELLEAALIDFQNNFDLTSKEYLLVDYNEDYVFKSFIHFYDTKCDLFTKSLNLRNTELKWL